MSPGAAEQKMKKASKSGTGGLRIDLNNPGSDKTGLNI